MSVINLVSSVTAFAFTLNPPAKARKETACYFRSIIAR